jgi:hypothetical protein
MREIKYIVGHFKGGNLVVPSAVMFGSEIPHSQFAILFDKILGAGFCVIESNKAKVYGESYTLKVKAQPKDVVTLEATFCKSPFDL